MDDKRVAANCEPPHGTGPMRLQEMRERLSWRSMQKKRDDRDVLVRRFR